MLRQILLQIWYYRRSSLWLLCELVVIFITSWFLVNEIWTAHYRARSTPYGYDYEGVYIVEMEPLSEGQPGYVAAEDTYEASTAAIARFGQALLQMPEVSACAVTGMSLPGLSTYTANMQYPVDTAGTYVGFSLHSRQAGEPDMELMGYRQVWPENAPIEDLPGTCVISSDLAQLLFPGENPVGRRLSDASTSPEAVSQYSWVISGVIEPLKHNLTEEPRPMVLYAYPNMLQAPYAPHCFIFRLRPGVDADIFVDRANRTWEREMPYGNWRVSAVTPMPEYMKKYIFLDNFKWKALWIFLTGNVLIAAISYSWLRLRMRRSETGVRRAMGSTVWRIALQQLAEAWIVCAAAAVIGWIITANIILIAGINITSGSSMTLQSVRDSLPLLYAPTLHFLAVAGIVTAVLLAAVTLAALIPLGKALRERTADILKDE